MEELIRIYAKRLELAQDDERRKTLLNDFLREAVNSFNEDYVMECLAQSTFHMSDEEARPVIDDYIKRYPLLLAKHDKEWYYKHF